MLKQNINEISDCVLVPYYLVASYGYYILDESLLPDTTYDLVCKELDEKWDIIEHQHKGYVDREQLKAGTAYTLRHHDYPQIVRVVAQTIVEGL